MSPTEETPLPDPSPSGAEAAEACISEVRSMVTRLAATLSAETELVKRARLTEAAALSEEKTVLIAEYLRALEALKANSDLIRLHAPRALTAVREQHEAFRSALEANLAVLGTARAVSESLVRGVATELGRIGVPTTYEANGAETARAMPTRPLAVSRQL